jgi:hypothetical protein
VESQRNAIAALKAELSERRDHERLNQHSIALLDAKLAEKVTTLQHKASLSWAGQLIPSFPQSSLTSFLPSLQVREAMFMSNELEALRRHNQALVDTKTGLESQMETSHSRIVERST